MVLLTHGGLIILSSKKIGVFFIDNILDPSVVSSDYLNILISDHAPLVLFSCLIINAAHNVGDLILFCLILQKKTFVILFQPLLITSSLLIRLIQFLIHCYGKHLNGILEDKICLIPFILIKSTLRGSKNSNMHGDLDHEIVLNPSPELLKQCLDLQAEFDLILTKDAEQLLMQSRGSYYEHGDNSKSSVGSWLRRQSTSCLIPIRRNTHNVITTDPAEINATFQSFYSLLYKSEFPADRTTMNEFLHGLCNPIIDPDTVPQLDYPLSLTEITHSIKAIQSNKALCPNGFPVEFYKIFIDKLALLLLSGFRESLEHGSLPPTLTQATITLLLKAGKDPSLCTSVVTA